MSAAPFRYAYGPVPSRRLGKSLGLNNIPPKKCTYACVYCQVGKTTDARIDRRAFYDPEDVFADTRDMLKKAAQKGERVDFITFVPDGEPTLDVNLGALLSRMKSFGIPLAVITNSSLIWREDVREELAIADWVSLKVDSVQEAVWRAVNRPIRKISLSSILDGLLTFAKDYPGKLVTETMLIQGLNDQEDGLRDAAAFLSNLKPHIAYLSIPTRPPAESWVHRPAEETLNRAYQILSETVEHVEFLIMYEGDSFAITGNPEEDLLRITAVHPMREDALNAVLSRAGADWALVERLAARGDIVETQYAGYRFFLRGYPGRFRRQKKSAV